MSTGIAMGFKPIAMKKPALGIVADTGPWLMPVQYERIARPQATPPKIEAEYRDKNQDNDKLKTPINAHVSPLRYCEVRSNPRFVDRICKSACPA